MRNHARNGLRLAQPPPESSVVVIEELPTALIY
jgi:hypothetical protein